MNEVNRQTNINFHNTFCPDLQYISRILQIADRYEYLSKEDIFEITGIPTGKSSGKVEPHIQYCKYMGLITYDKEKGKYLLKKTELGEIILQEDRYLEEDISKYLCNYFLTSKYIGAPMWFEMFRKIPIIYGDKISVGVVVNHISKIFNITSKLRLGAFNGTYIKEQSLASLKLIEIDDNNKYYNFKNKKYMNDLLYVYIYTLTKELTLIDKNRSEFTINEILEDILWHKAFNFDEHEALNVLEILESKNFIKINKQLTPITIILNNRENIFLKKLYSLLI